MVVKLIFENFDKFCSCICIYQKMFVSLQPNLDLSSIWGCSESHRSRDVKPWLPYMLGARKQKTVPSVEQAGANPARHIVAKAKRRPAFVCWKQRKRLLTLVIRCFETWEISYPFRMQDISRCSWVYHTLMRTLFLRCACVCYTRVGFCMFIRR